MKFLFRNSEADFFTWCRHYVRSSLEIVEKYERNRSLYSYVPLEEYYDALRIQRQYAILKDSINEEQNEILEFNLIGNEPQPYNNRYFALRDDIFHHWQKICFHKKKPRIKQIDKFLLGHKLRELRIEKGLSAAKVAGLLNISTKCLYAYETGLRLVNLNVIYGMSQIYGMKIDDIISCHHKEKT